MPCTKECPKDVTCDKCLEVKGCKDNCMYICQVCGKYYFCKECIQTIGYCETCGDYCRQCEKYEHNGCPYISTECCECGKKNVEKNDFICDDHDCKDIYCDSCFLICPGCNDDCCFSCVVFGACGKCDECFCSKCTSFCEECDVDYCSRHHCDHLLIDGSKDHSE